MKRGRQQTFGWEELEWYDLKKFVTFWRKKKRLALRDMTTKYHIFVIILVFPKENQIVFGRYWVVEFVKKLGDWLMAYSEIFK